MDALTPDYWQNRYAENKLGWDIGHCSRPLREYFDQLKDRSLRILIPGSGNSYEAEYLHQHDFTQVYVADWAQTPLRSLKKRVPDFPEEHLLHQDFFKLDQRFDLIVEQTFFCAMEKEMRPKYVQQMNRLLSPGGKLVGLLFNIPLNQDGPPFGGSRQEYENLFRPFFEIEVMETCYNSEPPRSNNELFIIMTKR